MIENSKNKLYKLLRWSEKYTKTDMVSLTKSGSWLFMGRGVGVLSSFILTVGFANLLSPESFGTYRFILSGAAIIGAFTLSGMGVSIMRSVAHGFEGTFQKGILTQLKWSIGIFFAGLAVATYYFVNDNNLLALSFLIAGSLSPFLESLKLSNPYLTGKQAFRASALYKIPRVTIPLISLLLTILLTDNPVIIVLVYFVSNILAAFLIYALILKKFPPNKKEDPVAIGYSKHLSFFASMGTIAGQIDKILIFHFLGAAQLAIYVFATALPRQLKSTAQLLTALTYPKIATKSVSELKRILPHKALIWFLGMVAMVGTYVLIAPFLFNLFFPQYLESVLFSQAFALILLFAPMSLFINTFSAHIKKRELYITKIGVPFVRVALLIAFTPVFGIWGVIAAILFTNIISSGIQLFLFYRL